MTPLGHRAKRELEALGVRVEAAWRGEPQRRAFVYLDADAERTITVMGERLGPRANDPLPWAELQRRRRRLLHGGRPRRRAGGASSRTLVATVRALDALADAHVQLDALVSSADDEGERYTPGDIDPPPLLVVRTAGAGGGSFVAADGRTASGRPHPCPAPRSTRYGAGDSFAGGLTYGLAEGPGSRGAGARGALRRGVRDGTRALRRTAQGGELTSRRYENLGRRT